MVGVLLALGAQKLVQDYADRESADDAKAALRAEAVDHDFYASEIEIAGPCIRAQVAAVEQKLQAAAPAPLPRFSENTVKAPYVIRIPDRPWSSSAWDAVRSNNALRQADPAFADQMYKYYAQLTWMLGDTRNTVDLAAMLKSLAVVMPRGEGERMRYIDSSEKIIDTVSKLELVAGQLRDRQAKVRLLPPEAQRQHLLADSGTIKFRRAHGLPLAPLHPADPKQAD